MNLLKTKKKTPAPKLEPEPKPAAAVIQPLAFLTTAQWRENSGLQAQLRALLEHPVMQMAEQTLLMQGMPSAAPTAALEPGISGDAINALFAARYHNRSGYANYRNRLHRLVIPAGEAPVAGKAWGGELHAEEE